MTNKSENIKDEKEQYPLLSMINTPADLRKLPVEKLLEVCDELRQCIISHLSSNPGHFASSMGAVEITVALHYVFDTPSDRLVWDVGHQAYPHKLLTGRREAFASQRTFGGISGFPNPAESEYDSFVAGHAGNSISAALGMAIADSLTPGREERKTVALIGDASISNGIAFEGLNNTSNNPNNLLIVLNDNDMSIDTNVGSLHRYLSNLTTSAGYNRWRQRLYQFFRSKGLINDSGKGRMLRFNNSLKALISGSQNIFEGLDIRYFGPFDGHDVVKLVKILSEIKDMKGPRLLHIRTVKGKGFPEAEKSPTVWHAPGKFNPLTGERISESSASGVEKWQDVFGKHLSALADKDDRVVGITAAMITGTSMTHLFKTHPERAFNVGISEGHAVTFAGGLAASGKRPFAAIYSSFLQRAYDNIIHDVAIQGLPVTFCIDRAGLVGEDGVTHHGFFDLAYLRPVPGLNIAVPSDAETLRQLMSWSLTQNSPLAIRYPRGSAPERIIPSISAGGEVDDSVRPEARRLRGSEENNSHVAMLAVGPIVKEALTAAENVAKDGIEVDVYDMLWVKPLDTELLREIASTHKCLITLEDGMIAGGFGSAVEEFLHDENIECEVIRLGVPDKWIAHGSVPQLRALCGYDSPAIEKVIRKVMKDL